MKGRDISTLKAKGEPNNTIAEADAIGTQEFDKPGDAELYMLYNENFAYVPGDPITAEWGDDVDIYRYELTAGDTLIAETSPADGPLWSRDFDRELVLFQKHDARERRAPCRAFFDTDVGVVALHRRGEREQLVDLLGRVRAQIGGDQQLDDAAQQVTP